MGIHFAEKFIKKYKFKFLVYGVTRKRQRIVFYNSFRESIEIDFIRLEIAAKNFEITIESLLQILLCRELGLAIDEELEKRNKKIKKAFKLIKQGSYTVELGEYLRRVMLDEQTIAGENGLMFIDPQLLAKYHEINERYLFGEPERIRNIANKMGREYEYKKLRENFGI
ncbi:hypothetical protein [Fictibacillus sp. JL2B1089]|uniref:hypothetical protein n=1 Tax=Fictibacillus sp. JL2B1089 TaxID=3399565 RepID=UPI003A8804D3